MKNKKSILSIFIILLAIMCVINVAGINANNNPEWVSLLMSIFSVVIAIALVILAIIIVKNSINEKKNKNKHSAD
jgi:quinol-cytochrome oxidoreductase complex cytochrome b subunit